MDNKETNYILKHSRKRDKELKYDFMPSMLEIIERPAHKGGTVIILGVFTLLIAAIIWACCSKTDVVVTATGSIQPAGNLSIVQPQSNGVIKAINVSEGAHVEKGDILVELDTGLLDVDIDQLNSQKKIYSVQKEVYAKLRNGVSINIDSYDESLRTYVQAIIDSDSAYKTTLADYEKQKSNAELSQQIAQIQLDEYNANGTQRQRQSQELVVQQAALAVEKAALDIENCKSQYAANISSKAAEIDSKLQEIDSSIEKYNLSKDYQNITAPVSGYVNSIAVNTLGVSVTQGQQLITIVPDDMPSEMVCYVKNMDIADVNIGMDTEIKLEAYPYNKYGTVKGKVKYISPSSFQNENMGSVYLVKIELTDWNDSINIMSG
ncbi:MAG: HlyD family efflux transporter periplasmic adaptor subunit, partial [Lachnospiraceae bacterium]|nr:HlyD family efflux transporter periplasmic adaptor subunit [Lachnospiraceae bacterium]